MSESCFHCGQDINKESTIFDEKLFCCNGCKSVYEILNVNRLSGFYDLNKNPGIRPNDDEINFKYLDTKEIFDRLVDFSEGGITLISLKIPVIHCSSCIWLLESLHTLNQDIKYSQVNFSKKTVQISFNSERLKLSNLVEFLTNLGYKPVINLESAEKKVEKVDKNLIIKVAIAGFAFGNGMFFSLPEYWAEWFGWGDIWLEHYVPLFRWLMFVLATAVIIFSASDYYKSAWFGLKNLKITIDIPIVIGIFALYFRSCYEVFSNYGPGYFDTLCGLLFFMLSGKIFQQRTYNALSYDRDYKSFYPIAVTKLDSNGEQRNIFLSDVKIGDRILVRNEEIIPVDTILINGEGNIDNSFITGESAVINKKSGDKIFAGGKQKGAILELEVIKDVNQSYLTQLWNKEAFRKYETGLDTLTNTISKYFTIVVLGITLISGFYWYFVDLGKMFQVVCAILIIACPCALALSAPFTLGHMMRILGRKKIYVKDSLTIEKMAKIDTLVFDKTGTITYNKKSNISFEGEKLSSFDEENIKTLLKNSNHPLSKAIYNYLDVNDHFFAVKNFMEISGKGYKADIRNNHYKIGSAKFINTEAKEMETAVYISKNEIPLGKYIFRNEYRNGIENLFKELYEYKKYILSGDNESERANLKFCQAEEIHFNQSPEQKLEYIQYLQNQHKKVAMIGDGLNDSGALKQSDIGIAVADDSNSFTPSSDIIIDGNMLIYLPDLLKLSKSAIKIVKTTFVISLIYNVIGLSLAVIGLMSPLIAAILMPVSSISVVVFTSATTIYVSRKYFKDKI